MKKILFIFTGLEISVAVFFLVCNFHSILSDLFDNLSIVVTSLD